jgi:hypothetical protein
MTIAVGHDDRLTAVESRAWRKCVRGLDEIGYDHESIDSLIGTLNLGWVIMVALDPQELAKKLSKGREL